MPSTSKKQHRFMEAVAHNPSFAKKAGVPQSVGKEFSNADKGKTFSRGGDMASKMDPKMMAMMAAKKRGAMAPRGGMAPAAAAPGGMGMGMKKGGMPMKMKDGKKVPIFMNKGGMGMAKGGGIESKGKTKGTMIKMTKGGKAC